MWQTLRIGDVEAEEIEGKYEGRGQVEAQEYLVI
jgi:hypothetical protein